MIQSLIQLPATVSMNAILNFELHSLLCYENDWQFGS